MNKTKIILLSIGGAALLGAAIIAVVTYLGVSSGSEEDGGEDFEYLEDEASRLTRLPVYPGPAAVKATEANRKAYAEWKELAMGLASAGDQAFEKTTPASFKARMNEEAGRMAQLPGAVGGRFVKSDFGFGFDEYIGKGKLPSEADLPRLQREWNDVSVFLGILIDAKASSVTALELAKAAVVQEPVKRGGLRSRKSSKKKQEGQSDSDVTRFNVTFTVSPEALVKVLNDIAANGRFVVAEEMSFFRTPDTVATRLGEKTKKQETGRRRHRGEAAAAVEAAPAEGENATGVVTDPAAIEDYTVKMKVAVYDFRTKAKSESAKEEQE